MELNPNDKYGLDGQYIHFEPNCLHPIERYDRIWLEGTDIKLVCVDKNTFVIDTNNPSVHFVTGYDLSKQFSIIK